MEKIVKQIQLLALIIILVCTVIAFGIEIIQMVSISLNAGITKKDFDITMALHPTISEEFVTMYG